MGYVSEPAAGGDLDPGPAQDGAISRPGQHEAGSRAAAADPSVATTAITTGVITTATATMLPRALPTAWPLYPSRARGKGMLARFSAGKARMTDQAGG
jgi:hypothetical protein